MSDESDDDGRLVQIVKEAAAGVQESRNQSTRENIRQSIQGWREHSGMSLATAGLIELLQIALGVYLWQNHSGFWRIVGAIAIAAAVVGLAEKAYRRL